MTTKKQSIDWALGVMEIIDYDPDPKNVGDLISRTSAVEAYHEFLHRAMDPEKMIILLTGSENEKIRAMHASLVRHEFE